MKLKTLLFSLMLTLIGTTLAQEPITITMWDFLAGGDGARMEQIVTAFNESHDNIQLERTTLEWGVPFYTKVRTAILAGQQPDVMTYHLSRFPAAISAGLLRPISTDELANVGLSTEDFFPLLVDKASADGKLYGVPLDTHPLVLYYNKDLLEQAGLLGPDGKPNIESMEDFTGALRQIKEQTGAYGVVFANANDVMVYRIWLSLVKQLGGEVVENGELALGEAGQRALTDMATWTEEGLAPQNVDYATNVALFTSGRAAFMLNGVWEVPTMVDATAQGKLPFEYGVIPLPTFYEQPANWADSHAFVIGASEKNPISEEKLQAVLEFISFVEENSLTWAGGGHIVAYLPVVNSPEYQNLEPNAGYSAAAERVVYGPDVAIAGAAGPLQSAAAEFFSPALSGQLSVDEALKMFSQEVSRLLEQN